MMLLINNYNTLGKLLISSAIGMSDMTNMRDDEQIDFQDDWSDIWWETLDDLEIISDSDLPQDIDTEFDDLPELIPFDEPKSADELNLANLDEYITSPSDNEWVRVVLILLERLISAKLSILEAGPIISPV